MKNRSKLCLVLLLTVLMVLCLLPATASASKSEGTFGQSVRYDLSDDGKTLTFTGTGAMRDCDIGYLPVWIQVGYYNSITKVVIEDGVTSVGSYAFYNCNKIETVEIADSVQKIGKMAFYGCKNLKSIDIPEGVTSISDEMFYNCEKLESVTLPSTLETLGNRVFYNCKNLQSVEIPKKIATLGEAVFSGCEKLEHVQFLHEKFTSIGKECFKGCKSLTENIMPETLTELGESAFADCAGIRQISNPASITSIPDKAFAGCTSLESFAFSGEETSLGTGVFQGCTSLQTITIPKKITVIPANCFNGCTSLLGCTFGQSEVTEIKYSAFQGCTAMLAIDLPATLKTIGESAFSECTGFTIVRIPALVEEIKGGAFSHCANLENIYLNDKLKIIGSAVFYDDPKLTSIDIPDSVTEIGADAFEDCSALTRVKMSAKVEKIGAGAFKGLQIKSITLPSTLKTIGRGAFEGSALESIVIPENVESVGARAFCDCTSLRTATLKSFGTKIDSYTFSYCSRLSRVNIPEGVKSIEQSAFEYCSSLYDIKLPSGLETIVTNAFLNCSEINSIAIPASMKNIQYGAFYNVRNIQVIYYAGSQEDWAKADVEEDSGLDESLIRYNDPGTKLEWTFGGNTLTIRGEGEMVNYTANVPAPWYKNAANIKKVIIENGVTNIGDYAFAGYENLISVSIPASVKSIGNSAFQGCNQLETIALPTLLGSIGKDAFAGCTKLGDIEFPTRPVLKLGSGCFAGCTSLTSLTILDNVTTIGDEAFKDCTGIETVRFEPKLYPPSVGTDIFKNMTATVEYPCGERWASLANTTKDTVTWSLYHTDSTVDKAVAPKCMETGLTEGSHCADCGAILVAQQTVNSLGGHDYTNWSVSKQPTYGEQGEEKRTCKRTDICEEVQTRPVAYLALTMPALTVETNMTTGKPQLSWNAVTGAECYEISRVVAEGHFVVCATVATTRYTDAAAAPGEVYKYVVRAVCKKNYSFISTVQQTTCTCAQPSMWLNRNDRTGKPYLTWDAVDGAEEYEIWRAASRNGAYTKMYTTKNTSYTNVSAQAGKTYYYKVKAICENAEGNSIFSVIKGIACKLGKTDVTAVTAQSSGKPQLTWTEVDDAVQYEVYRANTKNGTYTKMFTTTATQYTNTSANAGYVYYYKVKAIGANAAYCESEVVSARCSCAIPTAKITTNAVTGKPHIEWNAVSGASAYEIYRATSKNGAFVKYYTTEHTFFNNLSAEPGKTYYYKIVAVSKVTEASNSAESAVLTKVCDCAQPELSIMLQDGKPWMRWDVVDGSYAFEIYRATSKNGTYYKMHTTQNAYYINTTAVAGKTYYYKLKALCTTSSYGDSAFSEVKSITVK